MHRIVSLDVDNESDINWRSLSDPSWNMWSGHHLQQKWRFLKTSSNLDGALGHRGEYKTRSSRFPFIFISDRYSTTSLSVGVCVEAIAFALRNNHMQSA